MEQWNNTPEKPKPIQTLAGFIERQNEIQKQIESWTNIWKNHQKLLEKVLRFQLILKEIYHEDIDPIKYLEKLYFEEKLWMQSIVSKTKEMYNQIWATPYFYNSESALQKFFVYVLNWKLRDQKENKITTIYKSRDGLKSILKILERKEQRIAEFLSWKIKYVNIDTTNFDVWEFENLNFKYKQFIYILKNYFWVSPENYKKLQELSIWNQSFADRFNELFQEHNIIFTIWHKDIAKTFEKY